VSDSYRQLLDATIEHLRNLRAQGIRFVNVSPQSLATLRKPTVVAPPALAAKSTARPPSSNPVQLEPARSRVFPVNPIAAPAADAAPTAPLATPLDPEAKAAAMLELRERSLACVKCPNLASSRTGVVFGVGSIDAELMFVGEAPGADEDKQGEPFVGAAGQLLTRIIQTMGLSRETVYIANILKCRPDTPGQTTGNRKPTAAEMQTCIPYLHSQIDLIRPKALVALGATAIEGLLGAAGGISRLRGNWHTYRGIPLMPTFHPAYLLRNQALSEKRKVWEDMLKVMEKLGMPISDKQRAFFLPK
jgi:uracil-DNA glycosylase